MHYNATRPWIGSSAVSRSFQIPLIADRRLIVYGNYGISKKTCHFSAKKEGSQIFSQKSSQSNWTKRCVIRLIISCQILIFAIIVAEISSK